MTKTRNLFMSHSWTYTSVCEKLCNLLNNATNFSYQNYSVPKNDPVHGAQNSQDLYDAISQRVQYYEVVIIIAGKYAIYSDWIQIELLITKRDFNKPVLAIKPWANTQVSSIVRNSADRLENWSTGSIVKAIRELAP